MEFLKRIRESLINKVKPSADKIVGHLKKELSWVGNDEIKPDWYGIIQHQYKLIPEMPQTELRTQYRNWAANLRNILSDDLSYKVYLSGALGLSLLNNDFPRVHSNTDLAIMNDGDLFREIVSRFQKQDYFLFWRISGAINQEELKVFTKYHLLHPVSVEDALKRKGPFSRNLALYKVDRENNCLAQDFSPINHVRLFPHQIENDRLVCLEDKNLLKYPIKFFTGIKYSYSEEGELLIINQRYWRFKLKNLIQSNESTHPKHYQDLKRNLDYLLSHR